MGKMLLCLVPGILAAQAGPDVTLFLGAGENAASIEPVVARFRAALGDLNPNQAVSFTSGRREINWDGVGGTQGNDNLAGNAFIARGLLMSTPGKRLKVSGDTGTPSFLMQDVTPGGAGTQEFAPFSNQKIFAAVGSPIIDMEFRIPGSSRVACVSAFGVVFTDVDRGGQSFMEMTLADGSVRKVLAPLQQTASKGFSFAAARFQNDCIVSVRLVSGSHALDSDGEREPAADLVAVDDFIYSEPRELPVPSPY